jgi:dihydrodipicolinate synthase/N-acetylneuraminate lyase
MDAFQTAAIVLVGGTAGWVYLKLKERIQFLEHEVRWLRKELEALKPTEIKSEYD